MTDKSQNRKQHYGVAFDPELHRDLTEINTKFEQTREMLQKAAQRQNEKIDREMVLAFHRGYDGMDLFDRGMGDVKCQPWHEGNKPHRPQWAVHHHRYYFDGMTYRDIRDAHKINDFE